jgi:hypothetical protein
MSKFQSTISTVAALASIFGAGAAGWKLAQVNSDVPPTVLDQKINQLDQKLEDLTKPESVAETPTPHPVEEPPQVPLTPEPQPATLPPVPQTQQTQQTPPPPLPPLP